MRSVGFLFSSLNLQHNLNIIANNGTSRTENILEIPKHKLENVDAKYSKKVWNPTYSISSLIQF